MKNPVTPAGIEPATFRFVAQHLNHCATAVPGNIGSSRYMSCFERCGISARTAQTGAFLVDLSLYRTPSCPPHTLTGVQRALRTKFEEIWGLMRGDKLIKFAQNDRHIVVTDHLQLQIVNSRLQWWRCFGTLSAEDARLSAFTSINRHKQFSHCPYLHLYLYAHYSVPLVPQCKYLFKLVRGTIL